MVKKSDDNDFIQDFNTLSRDYLNPTDPRYIIHHLDKPDQFIFITFVPDNANVKKKMVYASSVNTIQKQLGGSERFKYTLYWNDITEVSPSGWEDYLAHIEASNPITEEESIEQATLGGIYGSSTTTRRSHLTEENSNTETGSDAWQSESDVDTVISFVQASPGATRAMRIRIDDNSERLFVHEVLDDEINTEDDLGKLLDTSSPEYNLVHRNGTLYFIYTCPSVSRMKHKMLYAFKKEHVNSLIERNKSAEHGEVVFVEGSDVNDISDSIFKSGVAAKADHNENSSAPSTTNRPRFNRPKPPSKQKK